jgi:hypothetical protein
MSADIFSKASPCALLPWECCNLGEVALYRIIGGGEPSKCLPPTASAQASGADCLHTVCDWCLFQIKAFWECIDFVAGEIGVLSAAVAVHEASSLHAVTTNIIANPFSEGIHGPFLGSHGNVRMQGPSIGHRVGDHQGVQERVGIKPGRSAGVRRLPRSANTPRWILVIIFAKAGDVANIYRENSDILS